MDGGPNSAFAQIDFAQIDPDADVWDRAENSNAANNSEVIDFSSVSMLDLDAPKKAVQQFRQGSSMLREQNSKQAIRYLEKAISIYPKFVSAYNALGLAYLDQQDPRARDEFLAAAKLDDQFPGSFLNLGILALSSSNFSDAESNLSKAASLRPDDARILTALAFAENGNHNYTETLHTIERVHTLEHRGMANAHYIGAAAALSLNDLTTTRTQLLTFLKEDPSNPLAPVAREKLGLLFDHPRPATNSVTAASRPTTGADRFTVQTFPNTPYLQNELREVKNDSDQDTAIADLCSHCETTPDPPISPAPPAALPLTSWDQLFTIRQVVDETALFFSVSEGGHMVDNLSLSDIKVRDDNKPPQKIVDFIPQSRLPLRLGLLIDVSNSVEKRFSFEKGATEKFIQKVLNGTTDLGFVAAFNRNTIVTQDFTSDPAHLTSSIAKLSTGGETALFDAIHFACWKLAAYPDQGRVARVLVVLTDGEDNSSHRSLKQTIEAAEAASVTVYTVSTSGHDQPPGLFNDKTTADHILEAMAERTGGESIFPTSLRSLDHYLEHLPDIIRSRYLIAYKPADFTPNGQYRQIQVNAQKNGKRLRVHVRKGYFARLAVPSADQPTRAAAIMPLKP
jgi:VWFA-related protein